MTKYSILELATIAEGRSAGDAFRESVELARNAEKWGYERIWFAEHHNMASVASAATVVLIGYVAANTETIRVGSGGIMLPNHVPLIVAEQFGTLGTLYPDRIDLGLGRAPGTDQVTSAALRRDPRTAIRFPEDVRELMDYLSPKNQHNRVRAVPREGIEIPVWILGSSTDSAYLAAHMGLPYAFASHFAPAQFEQALTIYRNHFRPSEQLERPYVISCVNAIAAETDDEADFLSSSVYMLFKNIITGKSDYLKPPVAQVETLLSPQEMAVAREMLQYSFVGGKERLAESIGSFLNRFQVDELMFTSYIFDPAKRLRSNELIAEVMREI